MSEIIEKYNLVFTYAPDEQVCIGITSVSPLLSCYIGVHDTQNAVGFLQFIVDQIINQNNTAGLTLPVIKGIKAHITKLDVTLFIETTANIDTSPLVEHFFTFPVADFLAVLENWKLFLTEHRTRKVEVKGGQRIINIITDRFANALVIEKAVAVNWPDCGGSIGEYYSVSQQPYEKQKELTAGINAALASGADSVVLDAITQFLNLFTDGEYSVTIDSINLEGAEFEYDGLITYAYYVREEDRFIHNFYPYGTTPYLFTRSYSTIDQDRVAYYAERIKEGARPKAVIYTHYYPGRPIENPQYVVDGHHKLLAYQQLRISPRAVLISKHHNSSWPPKNIIPQIMHILKPAELTHILMEDGNIADINIYMSEEITRHLDVIFREKCSIGITLAQLLYNAYHSTESAERNWALERLAVLRKNKNQGNRQYLYYKPKAEENGYPGWRGLYIENDKDFDQWQKIFLDDKKPPVAFLERQQEISDGYHLDNIQRHTGLATPQPPDVEKMAQIVFAKVNTATPKRQPAIDNSPPRREKSIWYYIWIIVVIFFALRLIIALMSN